MTNLATVMYAIERHQLCNLLVLFREHVHLMILFAHFIQYELHVGLTCNVNLVASNSERYCEVNKFD